jgi:hypothetical protein
MDERAIAKAARMARVTNKQPAPIQITAEQILREAAERQETPHRPPRQDISDPIEMEDFRMRSRKQYEDSIRRNRFNINTWLKYAKFEEEQRDLPRTRSVYERALDVDFRNVKIWIQYAEMEMRSKNVNHARNIWERAVTLLPRYACVWCAVCVVTVMCVCVVCRFASPVWKEIGRERGGGDGGRNCWKEGKGRGSFLLVKSVEERK